MRAWRTPSIRFELSFEAEPSTPRPTGAPAASSSQVRQRPEARVMFEVGQWQTPTPAAPSRVTSASVKWMPCASQTPSLSQPTSSRYSTGRQPNICWQ